MIEIPRAALLADTVAKSAQFFSFGTNDLTQTTMGLSRDDYTKFQKIYEQHKIFKNDPFAVLDQQGVGKLVEMATSWARRRVRTWKWGSAASTVVSRVRWDSAIRWGWTMCPARRIVCRLHGWRLRRRRCRTTKRKPCGQRKVQTWVCGAASFVKEAAFLFAQGKRFAAMVAWTQGSLGQARFPTQLTERVGIDRAKTIDFIHEYAIHEIMLTRDHV